MRKTFFLGVGRWLTAAVIGFFLLRMLFSGGSADVPFETVTNAVVQTVDLSETKTADAQMVRRLYGLDPADYAGCVLYYPAQSMGVTELLLLSIGQVLDAGVGVDARLRQDVLGALSANAVDIGEADLNALILRQVNTGNTCHTLKAPPIKC